jgi:hypothetical protein
VAIAAAARRARGPRRASPRASSSVMPASAVPGPRALSAFTGRRQTCPYELSPHWRVHGPRQSSPVTITGGRNGAHPRRRADRKAGRGGGGGSGRGRPAARPVGRARPAQAAQSVHPDDHRARRAGRAEVDHRAQPLRGGERDLPGSRRPDQQDSLPAVVRGGQPDPVHRGRLRYRLRQLRRPEGAGHSGLAGPDLGDHYPAPAAARARRPERPAVLCLRRAAGPGHPPEYLPRRQPQQPAGALRRGPEAHPGRREARPAPGGRPAEHLGHAHQHAQRPGLRPRDGPVHRAA